MAEPSVDTLYTDWQRFVQEHACMIRNGRMSGLTAEELNALSESYVARIDFAYSRMIHAEQRRCSWDR